VLPFRSKGLVVKEGIMPDYAPGASYSDAALLLAVQAGDHSVGSHLFERLTPLIFGMVHTLRPSGRPDLRDDVHGEVLRMLLDPKVGRFAEARGTSMQYLFGLVRNAVRIIERQRRPAFVARPRTADVEARRSRRDASWVYDHTNGCRPEPVIDLGLEVKEQAAVAMATTDPVTRKIAHLRFVEGLTVTDVGTVVGLTRFAVARRLDQFCREARRRLVIAGAA
jgi:DNA-directed RNA polymerase specialized sigma24 family protein